MQLHDLAPFVPARSEASASRSDKPRDTSAPEKGFSDVVDDTSRKEKPPSAAPAASSERQAADEPAERLDEPVSQAGEAGEKSRDQGEAQQNTQGQDDAPVEGDAAAATQAEATEKDGETPAFSIAEGAQISPQDIAKTPFGLRVAELAAALQAEAGGEAAQPGKVTPSEIPGISLAEGVVPAESALVPEGETPALGMPRLVKTSKDPTVGLAAKAEAPPPAAPVSAPAGVVLDVDGEEIAVPEQPDTEKTAAPTMLKEGVAGPQNAASVANGALTGGAQAGAGTAGKAADQAAEQAALPIDIQAPERGEGASKAVELAQAQAAQSQLSAPQVSMAEAMILSAEPESSMLDDMALIAPNSDARMIERGQMVAPSAQVFHALDMARNVAGQIADVARISDDGRVEVQLRPEELGRLTLSFTADGAGGMTVQLSAERPETLDLIKRNLDQLDLALADLGYGDVSYDFAEGDGEGDGGRGEGGGTGSSGYGRVTQGAAPEDRVIVLGQNARAASGGVDIRL